LLLASAFFSSSVSVPAVDHGNFIGTCTIAVLDADLRKGFMTADFELI
jgi:hypothetical protein